MVDNVQIFNAASMTSTNTNYSSNVKAVIADRVSFHLEWTGTPNGTFTVWASNKPAPSTADDTDWVQLDSSLFSPAITSPSGSASKCYIEIPEATFTWYRVKYVNASSTGTLNGWVAGKGV